MGIDGQHGHLVNASHAPVSSSLTPAATREDQIKTAEAGEFTADAGEMIDVAVIGAGPAGLIAAEKLAQIGLRVVVYERMPSVARKLLMAGRGGLNLTHSEPLERFVTRYRPQPCPVVPAVLAFPPGALIEWAEGLGIETFTGSSGRVFPTAMKASPLLRAWLARLTQLGVRIVLSHTLVSLKPLVVGQATRGTDEGVALTFSRKGAAPIEIKARAVLLALGGASWPRLGSDGTWVAFISTLGVPVTPLTPANAGLKVTWSEHLVARFAGTPLKRIALSVAGERFSGDLVVTRGGLEGGPAYACGPLVRAALATAENATACVLIDLRPDLTAAALEKRLSRPRGKQSTATFLRKAAGLSPLAIALLREPAAGNGTLDLDAVEALAGRIKGLPITVHGLAGLERAISTAGGLPFDAIDEGYMIKALPGVFAAGEMLDWEAPTGGYLLQGCFATGVAASAGIARYLLGAQVTATDSVTT